MVQWGLKDLLVLLVPLGQMGQTELMERKVLPVLPVLPVPRVQLESALVRRVQLARQVLSVLLDQPDLKAPRA